MIPVPENDLPQNETAGPARPNTRAIGASAEDSAVDYLTAAGYEILDRNFRLRMGEIDCIARDRDGTLVFVEVKSAQHGSCGHPFSWVTPRKQRTLAKVARCYLARLGPKPGPCRFDVIAIMNHKVDHLKNAFLVG
jgi:putative endonuclease